MSYKIDLNNIPKHIAVILDGNGRWAEKKNVARVKGHLEGVKRVSGLIDESLRLGVKVLTVFTFSTENWNRPAAEVSLIMNMLDVVLVKELKRLKEDNIRFQIIGDLKRVPDNLHTTMNLVIEETKDNDGLCLNVAFNYGSRAEIVSATKKIAQKVLEGNVNVDDIDEKLIQNFLYTKGLVDPDLLIRTSGERRMSNFLLWQMSYTELYFTDQLWPEFTIEEFHKAICDYQIRDRRFGTITNNKGC